jgi:hypothetical protein
LTTASLRIVSGETELEDDSASESYASDILAAELPSHEPTFEAASSPFWACNFRKGRCDEMMRASKGPEQRIEGVFNVVEDRERGRVMLKRNALSSGCECGAHSDPNSRGRAGIAVQTGGEQLADPSGLS